MLMWIILLIFALPLISYLIELNTEKKSTNRKLKKIQKRLKELERKNTRTSSDVLDNE
jgi:cell division protein FtsL